MKLIFAITADCANLTGDGKLNVMGVFTDINATSFPVRHPSIHLIVKFGVELGEQGQRSVHVLLRDPDGNELLKLSSDVNIPQTKVGRTAEVNLILVLNNIVFPHPGPYQFVFMVDRDYKGQIDLFVNEVPAEQPKS